MKKRTLAAAGLAMIMAVSLAGCSTTVSVPDTVKVENVGDSSDGQQRDGEDRAGYGEDRVCGEI